jgi:hypothetical protein
VNARPIVVATGVVGPCGSGPTGVDEATATATTTAATAAATEARPSRSLVRELAPVDISAHHALPVVKAV